jgi:hypothetical protein
MTSTGSIQTVFLEQIRSQLAAHLSLADELAEQLSISRDSAYRRIRGETVLSLDEVKVLSRHYGVLLDGLVSHPSGMVSFQLRAINSSDFSFEKWLKSLLANLEIVSEGEMIWHAKDLPIFHYFQFPRLAAFKMYFWMKSFMREIKYANGRYNEGLISKDLMTLGGRIWEKYAAVASTEIINYEILNVTLRQIEFAHECGMFEGTEGHSLCDDCSRLVRNLKIQAELGAKRTFGEASGGGKFDLYLDEVLIGDNTVLLKAGGKRITIITHNNFNLLTTTQESFCQLTEDHMNTMFSKSTLISQTAEKERSRFFNKMEEKISELRRSLS